MGRNKREDVEPEQLNRREMQTSLAYAYVLDLDKRKYAKFRRENENFWGNIARCKHLP